MRVRRILLSFLSFYLLFSIALGVFLGRLPFRSERIPIRNRALMEKEAKSLDASLRDVSINSDDGIPLRAWFSSPRRSNGSAVILLHGVGDNREGTEGLAQILLSRQYVVLMPDSRGEGESGGNFPTYGIKERGDLHHWVEWLHAEAHPRCVFGAGESMGAAILLQDLQENDFCAVAAESPFADFRRVAYLRVGQMFGQGAWLGSIALRPAVEVAFLYARALNGVDLTDASPELSVETTATPVLLIHGLKDLNIPIEESRLIQLRNPTHVSLWEVPAAGHCGAINAAPEEFRKRVIDWFQDHDLQP